MADGFDKERATTDLRQLLNIENKPQSEGGGGRNERNVTSAKKRKKSKKSKDGTEGNKEEVNVSQQGASSNSPPVTHSNSNGNALQAPCATSISGQTDFDESGRQKEKATANPKSSRHSRKKDREKKANQEASVELKAHSPATDQLTNSEISIANLQKKSTDSVSSKSPAELNAVKISTKPEKNRKTGDTNSTNKRPSDSATSKRSSVASDLKKNVEAINPKKVVQGATNAREHSNITEGEKVGEKNNISQMDGKSDGLKSATSTKRPNPADSKITNTNNNKPRPVKLGEEDISPELLLRLEENKMHVLKKKNQRFPKARFFCRLCDYHLDQVEDCDKHIRDNRHCRRKEISAVDAILKLLPKPMEQQLIALTKTVDVIYTEHGMDEWEQKMRADMVGRLERTLQEKDPDIMLYMYGSSLSGFGLKTADVNVDLDSKDKDKKLTFLLKEVYTILKDRTDTGFSNVRSDFSAKVPALLMIDDVTGLTVTVTIHCYLAHCSSELLSIYSDFDIRVRKLAVAFRFWANLCGLDRQCDGFFPPQALNLMVIYFLQVINPQVIPIIAPPKISGEEVGDFRKDAPLFEKMRTKVMKASMKSSNKMEIGELWLRLLKFYSLEFDTPNIVVSIRSAQVIPRHTKPWNSKKLAVEDPYMLKKNVTRMVSNSRIYEYWQDSIRKAYHYFGLPRDDSGKSYISEEALRDLALSDGKASDRATSSVGSSMEKAIKDSEDIVGQSKKTISQKEKTPSEDSENGRTHMKENESNATVKSKDKNEEVSSSAIPNETSSEKFIVETSHQMSKLTLDASGNTSNIVMQNETTKLDRADKIDSTALTDETILAGSGSILSPAATTALSDQTSHTSSLDTLDSGIGSTEGIQPPDSQINSSYASTRKGPTVVTFARNYAFTIINKALHQVSLLQPGSSEGIAEGESSDQCYSANLPSWQKKKDSVCSSADSTSSQALLFDGSDTVNKAAFESRLKDVAGKDSTHDSQNIALIENAENSSDQLSSASSASYTRPQQRDNNSVQGIAAQTEKIKDSLKSKAAEQMVSTSETSNSSVTKETETSELPGYKDLLSEVALRECTYEFVAGHFTDGKGPTLVCTYCEKEGHLKNACPDDELPDILPLPPLTKNHLGVLTDTLNKVPSEVGLSDESLMGRRMFLHDLEAYIRMQFDDAELALFGSSCNGFGFDKSDMDICMTFSRRNSKKLDKVFVIDSLARRLKQHGDLAAVQAITTAKVPIVKFTVKRTNLEGDISLYNTLGQQNTKLLYCYSRIDPRVQILGYAIKTFAKVCDIGDASRGSLSSYAYILMMLYYLQQVNPPVIPVLQELYKGTEKPKMIIEECDAWFMDDLSKLGKFWPEMGQNKMSVAELWLGFLRFYVEEFNYKEYVVSIRQKELLTRFEKLWNGTCIAVEDPFDLSHNLGSGLTRKMNNFIFKTFINGRMLYGSPIDDNMEMFNTYQCPSDYFFDTELLSECRPPNVRGCRRCGKIGHLVRHCPLNRKDRDEDPKQQHSHQHQQQRQHHQQPSQLQRQLLQQPSKQQVPKQQSFQQQMQHQQQKEMRERQQKEMRDRDRREKDRRQNGPAGNTNRNSSAPSSGGGLPFNLATEARPIAVLTQMPPPTFPVKAQPNLNTVSPQCELRESHFNFTSHPGIQPVVPVQVRDMHHPSQVYHNSNYHNQHQFQQPHHYQRMQHQQQRRMGNPNGPAQNLLGYNPQPLMSSTPRPSMNVINSMNFPPPGHGRPNFPSQQPNQQAYSSAHSQSNNNYRMPQSQQAYSHNQGNGGGGNQPAMNPVVQNLFASAHGQVLDVGHKQHNRRK